MNLNQYLIKWWHFVLAVTFLASAGQVWAEPDSHCDQWRPDHAELSQYFPNYERELYLRIRPNTDGSLSFPSCPYGKHKVEANIRLPEDVFLNDEPVGDLVVQIIPPNTSGYSDLIPMSVQIRNRGVFIDLGWTHGYSPLPGGGVVGLVGDRILVARSKFMKRCWQAKLHF